MNYEIAYLSQSGNTKKLAHDLKDLLGEKSRLVDLETDTLSMCADFYLIGFGINSGMIPLKIMNALEQLEKKTFCCFVTCGFEAVEEYREVIERKISPFLPDECDCKGLFLCQGAFSEAVLSIAKEHLVHDPENKYANKILHDAAYSQHHPNKQDAQHAKSGQNCTHIAEKPVQYSA